MRMRPGGVALVVAAGLAIAAAPAPAAGPLREVAGTTASRAWVDGERYAVLDENPRYSNPYRLSILDTRTGAIRSVRLEAPADVVGAMPECRDTDVGGGQMIWQCYDPSTPSPPSHHVYAVRVDLATGTQHELPLSTLAQRDPQAYDHSFGRIGSRWVEVLGPSPPTSWSAGQYLLDWSTGAVRAPPRPRPGLVLDFNAPGAVTPLCAPLRRRDNVFHRYEYDRPFALAQRPGRSFSDRATIEVERCGHRGHRVPALCQCTAHLAAGAISWLDRGVVHVYRPATGRDLRWRLAGVSPGWQGEYGVWVAHTRYAVIVSLPLSERGRAWRILAARI
jgi:hypothetical protein